MQTQLHQNLILNRHDFREIMKEAKGLIKRTKQSKYNLMHEQSLELYDLWSPYVLDDFPSEMVNSPGFKLAFMQVMSIIMALNGEKEEIIPSVEKIQYQIDDTNIINFLAYRSSKISDGIYNRQKGGINLSQ